MSCIDVSIRRIGEDINVSVGKIGGIEVSCFNAHQPIQVKVRSLYNELNITCGLVCSTGQGYYLRVVPDTVWLSPEEMSSATFDIFSNDTWKIINTSQDIPYLDVSKDHLWVSMDGVDLFDIYSNVIWKIN